MSSTLKSKKHLAALELGAVIVETARNLGITEYNAKKDEPMLVNAVNAALAGTDAPVCIVGKYVTNGGVNAFRERTEYQDAFRAELRGLAEARPEVVPFTAEEVAALTLDGLCEIRATLARTGIDIENSFFYALTTESEEFRSPAAEAFRRIIAKPNRKRPYYTIDGKLSVEKATAAGFKRLLAARKKAAAKKD